LVSWVKIIKNVRSPAFGLTRWGSEDDHRAAARTAAAAPVDAVDVVDHGDAIAKRSDCGARAREEVGEGLHFSLIELAGVVDK
jgi:hypothetical protein